MRILVNYHKSESDYLAQLAYILKQAGIEAVSTAKTLSISELIGKAKQGHATAILLCNEDTLRTCVPGDKPTLDKYRGSRLNFSIPAIVCNSLAHINTVSHGRWLLEKDLEKFRTIHVPPSPFSFTALTKTSMFEAARADLVRAQVLSVDVETELFNEYDNDVTMEGGDSVITSCAWTALMPDGSMKTYVLPLVDFGVDHWETEYDYQRAIQFMQWANALPCPKIMQNGMYDSTQLIRYHAEPLNWTIDTMGLAHCEYAELPQDLAFIASYQLYDYVYWKDDADLSKKERDLNKFWGYNAKDTWHTLRIAIQQLRTMPAYAHTNYAGQFKLVYPCLYCSFEGLLIDNEVREEKRAVSMTLLEGSRTQLREMFADPNFNPGSWQQVEKYIYKVFGARKPKIGKSKSCTDEKNLIAVGQQHPLLSRLTTAILDYRGAQKAIGTYYDFKQKNRRLLYSLDPFGTETDRMACRSSSLWVGTQAQNIPFYAKGMLVADPGYEIAEVDNSQSEARCTAYCAQELRLIEALESATHDFYRTLGTLFFNIPYEEVSDFFRNKVLKKIVHGTNYMMGAKTFIENIGVQILYDTASKLGIILVQVPRKNHPEEQTIRSFANDLLEAYHKPFPRVRMWYKEIFEEIQITGMLTSPTGHVRRFFGDINKEHDMLRGAVAHQPQNLSVFVLNKGLWRCYKELVVPSRGRFRLKAQVHDSILSQYPIVERDYWIPKMMECCRNPIEVHGRTLRIPVDAKAGPSWGDMKKYKPAITA